MNREPLSREEANCVSWQLRSSEYDQVTAAQMQETNGFYLPEEESSFFLPSKLDLGGYSQ